jgi:hypothetical protein
MPEGLCIVIFRMCLSTYVINSLYNCTFINSFRFFKSVKMREGRLIERREEMRKSKFPLKRMTGKRLLDGQKRRSKDSVK